MTTTSFPFPWVKTKQRIPILVCVCVCARVCVCERERERESICIPVFANIHMKTWAGMFLTGRFMFGFLSNSLTNLSDYPWFSPLWTTTINHRSRNQIQIQIQMFSTNVQDELRRYGSTLLEPTFKMWGSKWIFPTAYALWTECQMVVAINFQWPFWFQWKFVNNVLCFFKFFFNYLIIFF